MISINETTKNLCRKDSADKSFIVIFRDLNEVKTNKDIIAESLSITESICSDSSFKLGLCEASTLKLSMYLDKNVTGDELTIFEVLDDFEPNVHYDATKGIVFDDESLSIISEGSLSNIGDSSINFNSLKSYLLVGHMQYAGETLIYVSRGQNLNRSVYYIPNDYTDSEYINICIPIVGNDFSEYAMQFLSYTTVGGYFTLYESDLSILPLGVFHIDESKKSHEDAQIREIQGYDKMLMSNLDEEVKRTLTSNLRVDLFLEDILDNSPIQLGDNLMQDEVSGEKLPLTVVSQSTTPISGTQGNLVYRIKNFDSIITVDGTYTEYHDKYDPLWQNAKSYDLGGGHILGGPETAEIFMSYHPTYYKRFYGEDGSEILDRMVDEVRNHTNRHYLLRFPTEFSISVVHWRFMITSRTKPETVLPSYAEVILGLYEYNATSEYVEYFFYTGINYYGTSPTRRHACYILEWPKELSDLMEYATNNNEFSVDGEIFHPIMNEMDVLGLRAIVGYQMGNPVIYTPELEESFESSILRSTEIELDRILCYSYVFDDDIMSVIQKNSDSGRPYDVISKEDVRIDDYNSGKCSYYELLAGGIVYQLQAVAMVCSIREWFTKLTITYRINNYSPDNQYKLDLYKYNEFGVGLNEKSIRQIALDFATGTEYVFEVDRQDEVNTIIANNTTSALNISQNGEFTIEYIYCIAYDEYHRRVTNQYPFLVQDSALVSKESVLKIARGTRLQGSIALMELAIKSSPQDVFASRRNIISSYLELSGNFIHFNRLGTTSLIAPIATFNNVLRYYESDLPCLNKTYKNIDLGMPNIDTDAYIIVNKEDMSEIDISTNTIDISDITYSVMHTYDVLTDLNKTYIEIKEESLEYPVYVLDNYSVYEELTILTLELSNSFKYEDEYTYTINSNVGDAINFESNVKTLAESYGEIITDHQAEFVNLISDYDEKVYTSRSYREYDGEIQIYDEGTIYLSYISDISYSIKDNEDVEVASDSLEITCPLSIDGPIYYNDKSIFANTQYRGYIKLYTTDATYQFDVDDIAYTIRISQTLDAIFDYIDSLVEFFDDLIIDRSDYIKGIINDYPTYVNVSKVDGKYIIHINYISKVECNIYGGIINTTDTLVNTSYIDVDNPFDYIRYTDVISDNPVFTHEYSRYHLTPVYKTVDYQIPEYELGNILEYNTSTISDMLDSLSDIVDEIKSNVLSAESTLDIDRESEFIELLSEFMHSNYNENFVVDSYGRTSVSYIDSIICTKTVETQSNFCEEYVSIYPINYVDVTSTNAEPVEVELTRSLYIEDKVNDVFRGIKFTSSDTTVGNNYPYYYNYDGSTEYRDDINYYVVKNNFFIDNFIITASQLNSIASDMLATLVYYDSYNLIATYKALPYTEVCDKVCIEGTNGSIGKKHDLYYTVILKRTLQGNIGMNDMLETEFNYD